MKKNPTWSPEECAEYEALVEEAFAHSTNITERTRYFLRGVEDAMQASRFWANDIMQTIKWRGAQSVVKAEERVIVQVRDRALPGTVGAGVRRADGEVEQMRLPWEELTRDQLREARIVYAKQSYAANMKVATCAALDDLMKAHPSARTVGEALRESGADLQSYLDAYFKEAAA